MVLKKIYFKFERDFFSLSTATSGQFDHFLSEIRILLLQDEKNNVAISMITRGYLLFEQIRNLNLIQDKINQTQE